MKVWMGKLRLVGGRTQGPEVTARIVVKPPEGENPPEVIVDVSREDDALGQPRWESCGPMTLDQKSLCLALANTTAPTASPLPRVSVKTNQDGSIDYEATLTAIVADLRAPAAERAERGFMWFVELHKLGRVELLHAAIGATEVDASESTLGQTTPTPADVYEGAAQ